jgi:hypothetical protein
VVVFRLPALAAEQFSNADLSVCPPSPSNLLWPWGGLTGGKVRPTSKHGNLQGRAVCGISVIPVCFKSSDASSSRLQGEGEAGSQGPRGKFTFERQANVLG